MQSKCLFQKVLFHFMPQGHIVNKQWGQAKAIITWVKVYRTGYFYSWPYITSPPPPPPKEELQLLLSTSDSYPLYGVPVFNQQMFYECWLWCYSTPQTLMDVDLVTVVSKWYKTFQPPQDHEGWFSKGEYLQDATLHFVLSSALKMSLGGFQKSRKSLMNLSSAVVWWVEGLPQVYRALCGRFPLRKSSSVGTSVPAVPQTHGEQSSRTLQRHWCDLCHSVLSYGAVTWHVQCHVMLSNCFSSFWWKSKGYYFHMLSERTAQELQSCLKLSIS